MSDWPSETAGEIVEPIAAGHRPHVFGIDSPNEKLPPLITSMTHTTYAGQGAQLAPNEAMHTHPQVLFAARSLYRVGLARELKIE
jgi:hypothetical protein